MSYNSMCNYSGTCPTKEFCKSSLSAKRALCQNCPGCGCCGLNPLQFISKVDFPLYEHEKVTPQFLSGLPGDYKDVEKEIAEMENRGTCVGNSKCGWVNGEFSNKKEDCGPGCEWVPNSDVANIGYLGINPELGDNSPFISTDPSFNFDMYAHFYGRKPCTPCNSQVQKSSYINNRGERVEVVENNPLCIPKQPNLPPGNVFFRNGTKVLAQQNY